MRVTIRPKVLLLCILLITFVFHTHKYEVTPGFQLISPIFWNKHPKSKVLKESDIKWVFPGRWRWHVVSVSSSNWDRPLPIFEREGSRVGNCGLVRQIHEGKIQLKSWNGILELGCEVSIGVVKCIWRGWWCICMGTYLSCPVGWWVWLIQRW